MPNRASALEYRPIGTMEVISNAARCPTSAPLHRRWSPKWVTRLTVASVCAGSRSR